MDIGAGYPDIVARTVVDLNDELVERAKALTGLKRKVDVVNEALRVLVENAEACQGLLDLRGKIRFRVTGRQSLRERHASHR